MCVAQPVVGAVEICVSCPWSLEERQSTFGTRYTLAAIRQLHKPMHTDVFLIPLLWLVLDVDNVLDDLRATRPRPTQLGVLMRREESMRVAERRWARGQWERAGL